MADTILLIRPSIGCDLRHRVATIRLLSEISRSFQLTNTARDYRLTEELLQTLIFRQQPSKQRASKGNLC